MLHVSIRKARVHVEMRNKQEGSVLQGTVQARCLGVETRLELDSDEDKEHVRRVARLAEAGCFTLQSLLHEVEVTSSVLLNGAPLFHETGL
jgi:uncharacterized OsmC-like protein